MLFKANTFVYWPNITTIQPESNVLNGLYLEEVLGRFESEVVLSQPAE